MPVLYTGRILVMRTAERFKDACKQATGALASELQVGV